MTKTITAFFGIAVMTAVLVGGLTYTQSASATMGYMDCSTDKFRPQKFLVSPLKMQVR